jgi:glycosyltransferase involved in cell wall biosynthesis
MKCAVIVAAFNAQSTVMDCLKAIERQRLVAGWTFEIRLGVDGCHMTASVLQRARKPFYYSKENRGTYVMANSLIALGPADVYARFDADDVMLPGYLSTMIPVALDWGLANAGHIVRPNRFSKPRIGQVTFTHETLRKLGGFHSRRCHCDRDFVRRAEMAGIDNQGMRKDPRLQRGLFLKNTGPNSLTRSRKYGHNSSYRRRVRERVFEYSVKKHMPNAQIIVVRDIPKRRGRGVAYDAMTNRLDSWVPVVMKTKGDIILCDVDLIFRADLFKVFQNHKFDVAYTGRNSRRKPINGGIVFIRDGAQGFVKQWAKINRRMHKDRAFHRIWRKKCCGMNQPAFWYLLKNPKAHKKTMLKLPCLRFNACETEWAKMGNDVKVIHLKRELRRYADGKPVKLHRGADRAIKMWREYEVASRNQGDES